MNVDNVGEAKFIRTTRSTNILIFCPCVYRNMAIVDHDIKKVIKIK